jgi:hypothetical protein
MGTRARARNQRASSIFASTSIVRGKPRVANGSGAVDVDGAQAEKEVPQPQVPVAWGFLKTKPRSSSPSLKSKDRAAHEELALLVDARRCTSCSHEREVELRRPVLIEIEHVAESRAAAALGADAHVRRFHGAWKFSSATTRWISFAARSLRCTPRPALGSVGVGRPPAAAAAPAAGVAGVAGAASVSRCLGVAHDRTSVPSRAPVA